MNYKKPLRISLYLFLVLSICLLTFIGILIFGGFGHIPSKSELKGISNESASLIYSEEGKLIGKFFAKNRTNISYDSLPQHLIDALVATEDARFYEHEGLDGRSVLRVIFKTILAGDRSSGGGSTLSQQLAKNLYGRKNFGKFTLFINKLKEIILARRIEDIYSKREIIQLYLNTVPFGENLYGIESAAQRFFNCSTSRLKVQEAAVLIGLLKANSYYNPRTQPEHALNRRQIVLSQMEKYEYLNATQADSIRQLPLTLKYANLTSNNPAPYFLKRVKKEANTIIAQYNQSNNRHYNLEKDGLVIKTSLDLHLQKEGQKASKKHLSKMQIRLRKQYQLSGYSRQLNELANKISKQEGLPLENQETKARNLFSWNDSADKPVLNLIDSIKYALTQLHNGVLGINPKTGAIKTWVGGIDFQSNPFDQVLAKRQLASTFKPILYASALMNEISLCDYLSNEEIALSDYEGWSPKNYDGESGGEYSVAAALAYSKNIPTLHLYLKLEWEKLQETWNKLGFIEALNREPSVILGTNSVSMLELAIAYSSFANGGFQITPYSIESIHSEEGELIYQKQSEKIVSVIDKEISLQINEALIKAVREGTGNALPNRYGVKTKWAGKTGTSQDYADAWFVAYNQQLVLVSRVGATYPSIHFSGGNYGSGSSLALPIIGEILIASSQQSWYNAGIAHSKSIDCPDFIEEKGIDKILKIFKKSETSLERERQKVKRKEKRKSFFKKLFGGD